VGKLNELMDEFVDEMDLLAIQISEVAIPSGDASAIDYSNDDAFLSSLFEASRYTFTEISNRIEHIKSLVREIKVQVMSGEEVTLSVHKNRVRDIDKNSAFVRVANASSLPEDYADKKQVNHYKEIEKLIIAYRSLILEFNACVNQYNLTRGRGLPELTPFASVDMSPLGN